MSMFPIKDGEFTSTVYGMIKENRFTDAMRVLQYELQRAPDSRAALSLLGFCYYNIQDYIMAAECYGKLTEKYPQQVDYKLNHAQALYNAFMFPEAVAVLSQIDDPKLESKVVKLDAAIKYREEDLNNARILVEQFESDDPDVEVNMACLDFKEGKYKEALTRFTKATQLHGYQSDLTYDLALCHYQLKEYQQALKYISEIVDRGVKDYPVEAASEALTDMPPRSEEELDPVTLHNQALIGVDNNLADSFAKLQYLLSQNPFPPETFANLLLLYCKYEYYDLAADVLAENAHLTYKYLTQYIYDYLDALITQQSSAVDAYSKFDAIANEQLNGVRKSHQKLQVTAMDVVYAYERRGRTLYGLWMNQCCFPCPHPLLHVDETVVIEIGNGKITDCVKFESGNFCIFRDRSDIGRLGIIRPHNRHLVYFAMVHIKDDEGHTSATS